MALGGVVTGFFNAAGGHLWERVHKRIDPPPPPPRERYFVTEHQFDRWTGEPKKVHETLRSEGYEFSLQVAERVPAFKTEGWEHMLIDDKEIWWKNPARISCAFLMRKSA